MSISSKLLSFSLSAVSFSSSKIVDTDINILKSNEDIIPLTSENYTIGSSENKYTSAYFSNGIITNNIFGYTQLNIIAPTTVNFTGNTIINEISSNILSSTKSIFYDDVKYNNVGAITRIKYIIMVNSDLTLRENDSSATILICENLENKTITIQLNQQKTNDGVTFESCFIQNATNNQSYTILFADGDPLTGRIKNRNGNGEIVLDDSVANIVLSQYKIGDKIDLTYSSIGWLISGRVANIDNIEII